MLVLCCQKLQQPLSTGGAYQHQSPIFGGTFEYFLFVLLGEGGGEVRGAGRGGGGVALLLGRTPKGAYSSRGRSRYLLETPFSEPLLRTFYTAKPIADPLLRTLLRTLPPEPFQNLLRNLLRTLCCRTPP